MDNTDELRQSCHRMVDALNDPGLLDRARRFLTYLYLYREPDVEKDRPALPTPDGQAEQTVAKLPYSTAIIGSNEVKSQDENS